MNWDKQITFGRVSLEQKALFAKYLSLMIRSGLVVTESLAVIAESTSGRLQAVVIEVLRRVQAGSPLAAALAAHPRIFAGFFVGAVRAGESSGSLAENLENVSQEIDRERELVGKIRSALAYPAVVLTAALALALLLVFFILPKIVPLFVGLKVTLPLSTRILIALAQLVQNYGLYLFLGLVLALTMVVWLVRQPFVRPVTNYLLLHLPVGGRVVEKANLARFARTLAMLVKSGVNIGETLDITKGTVGNLYYQRAIEQMAREVEKGVRLSEALERHHQLFPPVVIRLARVGEEAGRFEEVFAYLGELYEAELDTAARSLTTAVEPLLLLLIGGIVAFFALSILSPIYEITGSVHL